MKKAYVKPAMDVEEFIPNIYCASCVFIEEMINANVYCAIPGNSSIIQDENLEYGDSWTLHPDHECGRDEAANDTDNPGYHSTYCDGSITLGTTGGTEAGTGSNIYDLQFGSINTSGNYNCLTGNTDLSSNWNNLHVNTYYNATWKSRDGNNEGREYIHYGALYISGNNLKNMS